MEAKQQDGDSVSIPFLSDYYTNKTESCDLEKGQGDFIGTTSFFKTTFNGLNALSGLLYLIRLILSGHVW